jgi:hypothetical protein
MHPSPRDRGTDRDMRRRGRAYMHGLAGRGCAVAPGILLAAAPAACGASPRTLEHRAPAPHRGTTSLTEPKGLVLSEVVGGAYVRPDIAFTQQLPEVAVYGDGRIFTKTVGMGPDSIRCG